MPSRISVLACALLCATVPVCTPSPLPTESVHSGTLSSHAPRTPLSRYGSFKDYRGGPYNHPNSTSTSTSSENSPFAEGEGAGDPGTLLGASLHCDRLLRAFPHLPSAAYEVGPPGERSVQWCERDDSAGSSAHHAAGDFRHAEVIAGAAGSGGGGGALLAAANFIAHGRSLADASLDVLQPLLANASVADGYGYAGYSSRNAGVNASRGWTLVYSSRGAETADYAAGTARDPDLYPPDTYGSYAGALEAFPATPRANGSTVLAGRGAAGYHRAADRDANLAQEGAWPSQAAAGAVDTGVAESIVRFTYAGGTRRWFARGKLGLLTSARRGLGAFPPGSSFHVCREFTLAECDDPSAAGAWKRVASIARGAFDTHLLEPSQAAETADPLRFSFDRDGTLNDPAHYHATPPSSAGAEVSCFEGSAFVSTDARCFTSGTGTREADVRIDVMAVGGACGDAVVEPYLERCDDGNARAGDGCDARCLVEPGFHCSTPAYGERSRCWKLTGAAAGAPSATAAEAHGPAGPPAGAHDPPVCGNGVVELDGAARGYLVPRLGAHARGRAYAAGGAALGPRTFAHEECDDGNADDGDGCSSSCSVEYGYACDAGPGEPCVQLPAVTCDRLYRRDSLTAPAAHALLGVESDPHTVWCIPEPADGGAWAVVLDYAAAVSFDRTPYELGSPGVQPGTNAQVNKMADSRVLHHQGGERAREAGWPTEWRFESAKDPDGHAWYVRSMSRWREVDSVGFGIFPWSPGHEPVRGTSVCRSASYAACDLSAPDFYASLAVPLNLEVVDDCSRILMDYDNSASGIGALSCFEGGTLVFGQHCLTAGAICVPAYPHVDGTTVSVRPKCTRCGDGCADPERGFEQCDDGNTDPGDGCSSTCAVEPGWVCSASALRESRCVWAAERPRSCLDIARAARNGTSWLPLAHDGPREAATAAGAPSGVYPVFPAGTVDAGAVRFVYCDMTTADPASAGRAWDELGGWTLLSAFSQSVDNSLTPQWVADKFFEEALWTEGAARGPPTSGTDGADYDAAAYHTGDAAYGTWSVNWREHLVAGRTYEFRQTCAMDKGPVTNAVDIAVDALSSGAVKQTRAPTTGFEFQLASESFSVRNIRDLKADAGIVWDRPGELMRLVLPYKKTDGDFSVDTAVYSACDGYGLDCCDCGSDVQGRYGNSGIIGSAVGNDPAFSYLPIRVKLATWNMAFTHQASPYDPGTATLPITCRYYARPKPLATPPAGIHRLVPLVRFRFEPSELASGGTVLTNTGLLGSLADANVIGACHGGVGSPLHTAAGRAGSSGITFTGDPAACRIVIPNPVSPVIGAEFTIAFWFRFAQRPSLGPGQLLLSRSTGDGTWASGMSQIYIPQDPPVEADVVADSIVMVTFGGHIVQASADRFPDDTLWHHYAFVSDGRFSAGRIFVDGDEVPRDTSSSIPFPHPPYVDFAVDHINEDHVVVLGGEVGGLHHADTGADGTMDDFAWFPHALDRAEVARIFRDGLPCLGGGDACQDGNAASGDGCSASCAVESAVPCDGSVAGDACADGNAVAGDGCVRGESDGSPCVVEPGWTCPDAAAGGNCTRAATCGALSAASPCNARTAGSLAYDPSFEGGGCAAPGAMCACRECRVAPGTYLWLPIVSEDPGSAALGRTAAPRAMCGDGRVHPGDGCEPAEGCDDGNTVAGDGCSEVCEVEPGYSCRSPEAGAGSCPASQGASTCVLVPRFHYEFNAGSLGDAVGAGSTLSASAPLAGSTVGSTADRCGTSDGALSLPGTAHLSASAAEDAHAIPSPGAFTLSMWVRVAAISSTGTDTHPFASTYLGGTSGWAFGVDPAAAADGVPGALVFLGGLGHKVRTTVAAFDPAPAEVADVSTVPVEGSSAAWTHVAVTWDGSSPDVVLYVNGARIAQVGSGSAMQTPPTGAIALYVGSGAGDPTGGASLAIDDFLLIHRGIDDATAASLYYEKRSDCSTVVY